MTMSKPQRTFNEQLGTALSRPYLWERCRDLGRVLTLANTSKDLSVAFAQICADIFGYAAGGNAGYGWQLTALTRNQGANYNQYSSSRDYLAAFTFLSSNGPMLELIHKLLPDPTNIYEYSITQLPNISIAGNAYTNQMGASVAVSSFEYFFYHFFNLPVRAQLNSNNTPTDTIYPILLEDYLAHFLPIDPIKQAKLFSQDSHASLAPTPHSGPLLHQSPPAPSSNRPSLFRKGFSPTTTSHPEQSISPGLTPNVALSNARETWRLDTIVRIISIFWLEPFAVESSKTYQPDAPNRLVQSQAEDSYVTATLRIAASLPSIDLMRCIRMFVKHAHYFSNSCRVGAGTLYLPNSLKMNIFGEHINVNIMFHFFRHIIGHWPLDASFKFVLETWLSYIQPWRYAQTSQGQITDENSPISLDNPEKWIPFLRENFQFFNNLLGQVLTRFLKQDLCSSKNAYMVFRIFKVYSQDHLMPTLRSVSTVLIGNVNSTPSQTFNASSFVGHQRNELNTWETEREFSSIFTPDFRSFISELLLKILESKLNEQESLKLRKEEVGKKVDQESNEDFFSKVFKFLAGKSGSGSFGDGEFAERDKMLQNLEFCIEKIAEMFQLTQMVDEFSERYLEEKERKEQSIQQASKDEFDLSGSLGLSPSQRLDIINKKIKPEARYLGNPDLFPIHSDEFVFLVRTLHKISTKINDRWGDTIADFYQRSSPAGALCRQICQPPTTYLEKSPYMGKKLAHLPPRLVLRPLASYRSVFYLFLYFFVCHFMLGKSIFGSTFWLLIIYLVYLCGMTFLFNPISPDDSFINESRVKKCD